MTGHHEDCGPRLEPRETGGQDQAVVGAQLDVDHGQVGLERPGERLGFDGRWPRLPRPRGRARAPAGGPARLRRPGGRPRGGVEPAPPRECGGSSCARSTTGFSAVDVTLSTRHTSLRRRFGGSGTDTAVARIAQRSAREHGGVARPLRTSRTASGGCRVSAGTDG